MGNNNVIPRSLFGSTVADASQSQQSVLVAANETKLKSLVVNAKRGADHGFAKQARKKRAGEARRSSDRHAVPADVPVDAPVGPSQCRRLILEEILDLQAKDKVEIHIPYSGDPNLFNEYRQHLAREGVNSAKHVYERTKCVNAPRGQRKDECSVLCFSGEVESNPQGREIHTLLSALPLCRESKRREVKWP